MTDFLEELLPQQEEEDVQPSLRSAHITPSAIQLHRTPAETKLDSTGYSAAQAAAGTETAPSGQPGAGLAPPPIPRTLQAVSAATATGHSTDLSIKSKSTAIRSLPLWDMVRHTYSAARLWQTRLIRPVQNAPGAISHTSEPFYRLPRQEAALPGYAALVDAAFARDARRYDGPLRIL